METKELLLKQLEFTYNTEDWYPPLQAALEGVTAEQANWRPEGAKANTIWENVSHLLFYRERLLAKLEGNEFVSNVQSNNDTFLYGHTEEEWQNIKDRFKFNQEKLQEVLGSLNEDELKESSFVKMISSIIMHDAYHTGQIIQLRKLQGSWSDIREF